jgi:hypothetical protein
MHNVTHYSMKMKLRLLSLGLVLLVIGSALYALPHDDVSEVTDPNQSVSSPPADELATVEGVVKAFGLRMQKVSVLADAASQQMDHEYTGLVTPELIAKWKATSTEAVGRVTSSPWPEKIEIVTTSKIDANTYKVEGNVIEVTSDSAHKGGPAAIYPVIIELQKRNDVWLIASFKRGPYSELPQAIVVEGVFTCLPHANTSGPQTDECALGIGRDQSDAFFALDLQDVGYDAISRVGTGSKIKVEGMMTPANQLSSNHWQKYRIDGIIRVTSIVEIK